MNKSHLTALTRKTLPRPTRWLYNYGLIIEPVLDYGCGKCYSVNPNTWVHYDPYYWKIDLDCFRGKFLTVVCNYVLCTLPTQERLDILRDIQTLLMTRSDSRAYVSVRNDRPKQGWGVSSRGTYQGRVKTLPIPLLYSNAQFRIYSLTTSTSLA